MSPEQVRGQPADARIDLFAFGAVLYEMLAGKKAFSGGLGRRRHHRDPAGGARRTSSLTNQIVPPGLERIVRRCLEKDPGAALPVGAAISPSRSRASRRTSAARAAVAPASRRRAS